MSTINTHALFGTLPRHAEFMDAAASILTQLSPLSRLRALRGAVPGWENTVWRQLAEAGWTAAAVPEHLGGLGLDIEALGAMATAVGEQPLPEPYLGAGMLMSLILPHFADHPLASELLQGVVSGDIVVGLAWQENLGELLPTSVLTSVDQDGDRLHLEGTKRWVSPAGGVQGWLVHARSGGSSTLVWVRADDPGLKVDTEIRVDGSLLCALHIDAMLPLTRMIGAGPAIDSAMQHALESARLIQASELYGIARRVYTLTLDYLKTRVQFGKPIGVNQALQHRMVDSYTSVLICGALLTDCYRRTVENPTLLPHDAALAKARIAERVIALCRDAVQLHGAIGYTDAYDVGLYLKRALHISSWLGSPRALQARYLSFRSRRETEEKALIACDDDYNAMHDDDFRQMVREFLRNHYPPHLRHVPRRLRLAEVREWYMTLSRHGWLAPAWPKEHGGMALAPAKLLIFFEEMGGWGAARLPDQGIINLGPILIQHGSAQQKAWYLPRILSGDDIWCQGYSEPNAGSDLASLRTEARREGDVFVVNGQKIWTTLAHDANHIFTLVRTDNTVKPQAGISFLLIDLKTPGVTVRPIKNIVDEEEFCEIFFENVSVPIKNLVGALNAGWGIAKDLLGYERVFAGSPQQSQQALYHLEQLAEHRSLFELPEFGQVYANLLGAVEELEALYGLFADIVRRGELLPPSVSALKVLATETYVCISREIIRWADEAGGTWSGVPSNDGMTQIPCMSFLQSLVTTIYGGANEIQRNIVAKTVLGMVERK